MEAPEQEPTPRREPSGPQPVPPGVYFLPVAQPLSTVPTGVEKRGRWDWLQTLGVLGVFASLLSLHLGQGRQEGVASALVEDVKVLKVDVSTLRQDMASVKVQLADLRESVGELKADMKTLLARTEKP